MDLEKIHEIEEKSFQTNRPEKSFQKLLIFKKLNIKKGMEKG